MGRKEGFSPAPVHLAVTDLRKSYRSETVLRGVSLDVAEGETLAVLGRSGGGKTTLLKIIAGLESADAGRVVLGGKNLDGVPPQKRGAVYLYQEPLLFPHLDVFENVAFGLRIRKGARADVESRVRKMLDELGIAEHAAKKPEQLSGGQQGRVAFGRAIIVEPSVLLLDEPFGKLDVETRAQMQTLFQRIVHANRITSLFVTHDLKEALVVGDRIGHLKDGVLTTYDSRAAFVADPATGVGDEVAFWQDVGEGQHG